MARRIHLDELDSVKVAGVNWRPVRRTLGVTAFGINAYTADRGEQLIEEHAEDGGGAGHEELYVVLTGHANFTVDREELDAPAGTLIFIPEPSSRRGAKALTDRTSALAVGGRTGTITPSAWEYCFAAQPAVDSGRPAEAYQIASQGLADHPDHPSLQYNLACYASLAGELDRAFDHLALAFQEDPRTREWAATDADLEAVRADRRWAEMSAADRRDA
jgi:hypothetical protein